MEIICLMGKTYKQTYSIAKQLETHGYSLITPYTNIQQLQDNNKEHQNYRVTTSRNISDLRKNGLIAAQKTYKNGLIDVPHPFGYSKYVLVATPDIVKALKDIYKGQVWSVYTNEIKQNTYNKDEPLLLQKDNIKEAERIADLKIEESEDSFKQAVKILVGLKEIKTIKDRMCNR